MLDRIKQWWRAAEDYLHISVMKYEQIPRHDDQPYLDRWIIFRCRWFSILLHKFIGSDDECIHTHPWNFVTILLKGGYWEWVPAEDTESMYRLHEGQRTAVAPDGTYLTGTWYPRWSILWRKAPWRHRVEFDPEQPAISLVIHGPKLMSWGFDTKIGHIHHSQYNYEKHCK